MFDTGWKNYRTIINCPMKLYTLIEQKCLLCTKRCTKAYRVMKTYLENSWSDGKIRKKIKLIFNQYDKDHIGCMPG